MGSDFDFWNVPSALADRFPHLAPAIERHLSSLREHRQQPYPHEFLESYLLPLLVSACDEDPRGDLARRASAFLEELLDHGDEDVVSATLLNVVEPIVDSTERYPTVRPCLGPLALRWVDELSARR